MRKNILIKDIIDFFMKRYTIKPKKLGQAPRHIRPKKVNSTKYISISSLIRILLVLIVMIGIGVGVYFLVNHIQENFGCQSCKSDKDTKNTE